ncbi:tripartite motif-containing protein 16-like [Xyrauchen texanus]|uniref:tripartite motif-containing protein 16-like n=1 Tax=Xyrauchen texanus TaxID=154827 RepID=UPI0022427E55|nr:tripartite motif-containing protein 16-like [Xyrauchen texanus]
MSEAALTFCCPVCLDVPRDPVTIPCGHSYCMSCISGCWDQDDQKGVYSCPQCRQTFMSRPALMKNSMLADLVEHFRNMLPEDSLCHAGPGDVPCDVCTETKYKAVKFCLVCVVSFCELHLKPHSVSQAYKGHKLVSASCKLQELICSAHKKPLEVFCQTDQQFVCLLCVLKEHREHNIVSPAAERQTQQKEFEEMQMKTKLRIQKRQSELTDIGAAVTTLKLSAESAVADIERIRSELMNSITSQCSEISELIGAQEKIGMRQAEISQEQLQQEISELQQRDADMQMLLHTEDDFLFLQNIPSLSNAPVCQNSQRVILSPHGLFDHVRKLISETNQRIMELLKKNHMQISREVVKVKIFLPLDPKTRDEFLQYSCELALDLKTAHNNLLFSKGNTRLTWGQAQSNPDHPERFDSWWQVLNKEGLTGCWFWEVVYSGTVFIALSYKSISTKGPGTECGFGRNDQSWSLCCTPSYYSFWHSNVETKLSGCPVSSRVGLYVDQRAGRLSFYSVSDTMSLIHSVQTTFTQPLYPGFGFRIGFLGSIQIFPKE